jgi:hypothetical protein
MVINYLVNTTATCGIDMTVIPFKRPTKEEADQQMLDEIAASKKAIFDLIEHNEMLDDDGYPTEVALDVIELWHWTDAKGWFKLYIVMTYLLLVGQVTNQSSMQ